MRTTLVMTLLMLLPAVADAAPPASVAKRTAERLRKIEPSARQPLIELTRGRHTAIAVAGEQPVEPTVTSRHLDDRGTTIRQYEDDHGRLRLRQTTVVRHRKGGETVDRVIKPKLGHASVRGERRL